MFVGSIVALVTPMDIHGLIDIKAYKKLIEQQIEAGTNGIVITGTTGEATSLKSNEVSKLIKVAVKTVNNRIPVIAGTGLSCTHKTIEQSLVASKLGVDGCLIVTPYYNCPSQEGLYSHYQAIAQAISCPIILYNVPKRTGVDLMPETVLKLSIISNIVGLKETSTDNVRLKALTKLCPENFTLLSGDDASALSFIMQGARGVISVTANLAPNLMQRMCSEALNGNFHRAAMINGKLMPLHKNLYHQSNPIPVKWAMKEMGWITDAVRLPLTPLSPEFHEKVRNALIESGILIKHN